MAAARERGETQGAGRPGTAADGYHLLQAARARGAPGWLRDLPAVEVLRQVWVQQYTRGRDGTVKRREAGLESGLPPGRSRITSPYDLDARYSEKRGKELAGIQSPPHRDLHPPGPERGRGDAADVGGLPSAGAAAPNLITNVATTAAAVPDAAMTEPVHDMLAAAGLSPGEHAADAGYAGGGPAAGGPGPRHHPARPPRCPVLPASPRRRLHRGHVRHRLGPPSRSPAPRERPASPGPPPAPAAATDSPSGSPPPPAGPARPAASAPPRPAGGSCSCAPATSTRPSPPCGPARPPGNGKTGTPSGPASKAPSARPPPSPASAPPATTDCPKPASSTPPPPQPST